MTTATLTTVSRPTEDAIIAIDRALNRFERELGREPSPPADLLECLRAAQSWLMTISSEIHRNEIELNA